jgi:tetratricopeptide (TPR) repeat protein
LRAGREAFARHAWREAFEQFREADAVTTLDEADLESLSVAAFFAGHADLRVQIAERAFLAYQRAGDAIRAAYVALQIAAAYALRGKLSVASAWTRRAERLLDGRAETYAHGYLALTRSNVAKASGDIARALELADEAVAIGERTGHPDL